MHPGEHVEVEISGRIEPSGSPFDGIRMTRAPRLDPRFWIWPTAADGDVDTPFIRHRQKGLFAHFLLPSIDEGLLARHHAAADAPIRTLRPTEPDSAAYPPHLRHGACNRPYPANALLDLMMPTGPDRRSAADQCRRLVRSTPAARTAPGGTAEAARAVMVGGLAAIERCPQLPLRVDDLEIEDVVSQVSAERLGEAVLPTARRVHKGGIDVPLEASRSVADCAGPQVLRAGHRALQTMPTSGRDRD